MRWRWTALLAGALVLTACGGEVDGTDGEAAVDAESTDDVDTSGGASDDDATAEEEEEEIASDDVAAEADPNDELQELLDDLDFGDGGARVVLDGETYEFALGGTSPEVDGKVYLGRCQELFGAIAGGGYDLRDGRTVTMEFDLPPADWESYEDGRFDDMPPRVKIEDAVTGASWVADVSLADWYPEVAGSSQVDEWVLGEGSASGTATFIEIEPFGSPVEGAGPLEGTFELACAED